MPSVILQQEVKILVYLSAVQVNISRFFYPWLENIFIKKLRKHCDICDNFHTDCVSYSFPLYQDKYIFSSNVRRASKKNTVQDYVYLNAQCYFATGSKNLGVLICSTSEHFKICLPLV